jgi:hypothetical protein
MVAATAPLTAASKTCSWTAVCGGPPLPEPAIVAVLLAARVVAFFLAK